MLWHSLLKSYYRHVIDSNLGQDVKDHMHPVLTVSPEGVAHKGDGDPEPDYRLLSGCLRNSESIGNLDKLLAHLPELRQCKLS